MHLIKHARGEARSGTSELAPTKAGASTSPGMTGGGGCTRQGGGGEDKWTEGLDKGSCGALQPRSDERRKQHQPGVGGGWGRGGDTNIEEKRYDVQRTTTASRVSVSMCVCARTRACLHACMDA